MDEVLETLFGELCKRIEECQEKNLTIDMTDITRCSILIQYYIDGFNNNPLPKEPYPSRENHPLPDMSYEELCKLTRPPRITPTGHIGPVSSMSRYAEGEDNKRAREVDTIIQYGKELEKNKDKPFF